mmetsp:Transcript_4783/g.8218  ORF Transcript_4783/g.8218 Transcript_4783/m.8218 type:complete len:215 (-) Transcript_4783:58-702(-)
MHAGWSPGAQATPAGDESDAHARLSAELAGLPADEVWRIAIYAGLRKAVYERRAQPAGLVEFLVDESGPQRVVLALLPARALAKLARTSRRWRCLEHWSEHWYLAGVQDFGTQRRLCPSGRFERYDEAVLDSFVDWPRRYANFVQAHHCSIENLRQAVVRIVQSVDLELCDVVDVRRRLAAELQLADDYLSIDSVEQLLEDASSMQSFVGHSFH